MSKQADAKSGYTVVACNISNACVAIGSASELGHPSRGFMSLNSAKPQFFMALAAAPIFSPNCGLERIITGGIRFRKGLLFILFFQSRT
jgi:hypothetical protein